MEITGTILLFYSAKSQTSIKHSKNRLNKQILSLQNSLSFEFKKDNHIEFKLISNNWESTIFHTLKLAQSLGYQWIITGDINVELNIWTNHTKTVGIESINMIIDNPRSYN